MDENKKIWQECKKEIKKSVSFQAYQTWFSDLTFMSADFEQITLNSSTGNKNNITADIDVTATTLAIGYTF